MTKVPFALGPRQQLKMTGLSAPIFLQSQVGILSSAAKMLFSFFKLNVTAKMMKISKKGFDRPFLISNNFLNILTGYETHQ